MKFYSFASPLPAGRWGRPRRLSVAVCNRLAPQQGFGLLGIMVSITLGLGVMGVAYTMYEHNHRASVVAEQTSQVRDFQRRLLSAYAGASSFAGLTTQQVLRDHLYLQGALAKGRLINAWGGAIEVASLDLPTPTGVNHQNGWALTYEGVANKECVNFALHGGQGFHDVKVNGVSVKTGNQVDTTRVIALCGQTPSVSTVQFIQAKASPQGAQQPELTPCVPSPDEGRRLNCPAGQISSVPPYGDDGIAQDRSAFCNSAYGQMGWTPWQTISNTCAPKCVPPANFMDTATQSAACGPNRVTPAGNSTFSQSRARQVTYACPAPTGNYTTAYAPWSAWSPDEPAACAPKCVAPAATTQSQGITGTCPGGQVTASGATTFAQTQVRDVTYACPAPTGGYTTAYGAWQTATPSPTSVCAPKCNAPGPSVNQNYQWVAVNVGCPGGYTGNHTYQKLQVQSVTTTYSCPSPQGGPTSNTSYGGWADTGATQADNNTCQPSAPPKTWQWAKTYYYEAGPDNDYGVDRWDPRANGCSEAGNGNVTWLSGKCVCDANNTSGYIRHWWQRGGTVGEEEWTCVQADSTFCDHPENYGNYCELTGRTLFGSG